MNRRRRSPPNRSALLYTHATPRRTWVAMAIRSPSGVELVLGHAVVDDRSAVGRRHLRQRRQRGVERADCGGGRAQPQETAAIDLLCHLLLRTGYLES